jgi:hypothetical protein
MPWLSEISYYEQECINTIRDYYQFLTKMYLDESDVLEPPKDGWTDINVDNMQGLGKTDEVISLLRRLPYINSLDDAEGAPGCLFADWQIEAYRGTEDPSWMEEIKLSSEDEIEHIPPHVIGLTIGAQENPKFLLDTNLGVVYWVECPEEIRNSPSIPEKVLDYAPDYAPEEEADWRNDASAWAIADFFETLKIQFRELQYYPTGPRTVRDVPSIVPPHERPLQDMIPNIFREHGWLDLEQYRKEDCLREIKKLREEREQSDEE